MGISKLLSDKKFVSKIMSLDKTEEVQKAFKEQKVDLSIEECEALMTIIKIIAKKKRPLNSEELESISGGKINLKNSAMGISMSVLSALGGITPSLRAEDKPKTNNSYINKSENNDGFFARLKKKVDYDKTLKNVGLGVTGLGLLGAGFYGLNKIFGGDKSADNPTENTQNTSPKQQINVLKKFDTSRWLNRSDFESEYPKTIGDYVRNYMCWGSDVRYLGIGGDLEHAKMYPEKYDDKEFPFRYNKVAMCKRFGHLQQVIYFVEFFLNKVHDENLVKELFDERFEHYKWVLNKAKLGHYNEYYQGDTAEEKIQNAILDCESIINSFENTSKTYKNNIVKLEKMCETLKNIRDGLLEHPDKIPDFKFSDEVINIIYDAMDSYPVRGSWLLRNNKPCRPLALVQDEKTDRIIALLENFAMDGGNDHHDVEKVFSYVLFGKSKNMILIKKLCFMGTVCLADLDTKPASEIPSKNFPNPYRED